MKLENYFAAIYFAFAILPSISQVDSRTLEEIAECQKLLKKHRNYSDPNIIPKSILYADLLKTHILPYSSTKPESLFEIARNDYLFLQTIKQFKSEIQQWGNEILSCPLDISVYCSNATTIREIGRQASRASSLQHYYTLRENDVAKQNKSEVYEQIAKDKKVLGEIETTQMDLCASGDSKCQECLEKKVDLYFSEGVGCNTYRHWHLIKYKPIQYNRCRDMKL